MVPTELKELKKQLEKLLEKEFKVSIIIASAVTSYSRVLMSLALKHPEIYGNVYYTDTDSIFTDKELPMDLVSNTELGKFKLEYVFKEAVFLGPKMYAGVTTDNKYISKVKGFKDAGSITFEDMKSLLHKNGSLKLSHSKWFRNLFQSEISIKEQIYNLQKTSMKREFVYDENGIAINTKPYKINCPPSETK